MVFAARLASMAILNDVDEYGVPLHAFGDGIPPEFFEILGRLIAVNGKIEYLKERLDQVPPAETNGVRRVEQFMTRYESGRLDRNSIVHSFWTFDADSDDSEAIVGVRYKMKGPAAGEIASIALRDNPGSEHPQVIVQQTLSGLRALLKRDLRTMLFGELAFTEIGLKWAVRQLAMGDGFPL